VSVLAANRHRWGSYRGGEVRSGITHCRLVLFPPGTTDREGTLLRIWRCWPFVGTLTAGLLVALLNGMVGTLSAVLTAAAWYAGGTLVLRRAVRRQRAHLCVLDAEYIAGTADASALARCRQLSELGATLSGAETAYLTGELSAVDFEHLWGVVCDEARALA
jgi:Family of unknown function (DUF6611)